MQVFYYDSIGSTSTEAFRFLNEKIPTPFAVTAKRQSAGRGQYSRKWESPEGNFFLSIACTVPKERVRFLPLMTACTLAQWLESKISVKPTIKWPNDLLLNKKKFAGILCESFWDQNKTDCTVVIGIGINIEEAPPVENANYEVEFLKKYLKESYSSEELVDSFIEFWENKSYSTIDEMLGEFERYHLPKGQLWRDRENPEQLYTNEGISPEGHLIVRNIGTDKIQQLVSAQHSLVLV